ncbi:MAG: ketopantoate reductase family protein, partial [Terracidiphilus sp.]
GLRSVVLPRNMADFYNAGDTIRFAALPRQDWRPWMKQDGWPGIAVMGAGAVGCYFGGLLARAGAPVTLIGRAQHVDAIRQYGLFLDTQEFQEKVPVAASTEASAAQGAGLILLCVKTLDTEDAVRALEPYAAPDAIVLSCQNGVDNVERIRSATRLHAIPAVTYVAAAMSGPGRVKHSGHGSFVLGNLPHRVLRQATGAAAASVPQSKDAAAAYEAPRSELEALKAIFQRAGIGCRISDNVEGELWAKMIVNCSYNAISALGRSKYSVMGEDEPTLGIMRLAIAECIAVAQAGGVCLPEGDWVRSTLDLTKTMGNATSSTAQDIARGKRTEIDSFNGYLVRRGKELGIATPVSQTLHGLIKLLEKNTCEPEKSCAS